MSRIGKQPVPIPGGVKVSLQGKTIIVEGPLGKMEYATRPEVEVTVEDSAVVVTCPDPAQHGAYHGLTRSLIANMVEGVSKGYEKRLEIVGVGYIAAVVGDTLQLRVGYAHEVHKKIPAGLKVTCPDQTHVLVQGCDKQLVGEFAAEVRSVRKPEPYKGKGIRYQGEHVKIKPGKTAT